MSTLFSIAENIRKCTSCSLYKNATLAIPGDGPKDAKIMVVGEAPGEQEDRQGLPFVGKSGKLLDQMLTIAGLDRKKVFITNIVKHRPPQNRSPQASEIKTCKELWLDQQIKILKPSLIVILGALAFKALTGKNSLEKLHGTVVEKDRQKYFVTYHPSAALRFAKTKEKMEQDFRKLEILVQKSIK